MGHAKFSQTDFLAAARAIASAQGPAAVTIASITARLEAPTGSFYHRFASRNELLGELWLRTVFDFQEGLVQSSMPVMDCRPRCIRPHGRARISTAPACC
jgi:AcrR family transcriptional regulator